MSDLKKCYNTDCSRYDESKEENCYDLNDASLCEDFHESKLRMWRTTRPGKECLCVVIVELFGCDVASTLKYIPEIDCFISEQEGKPLTSVKWDRVRCWIEYPKELIK